MILLLGKGIANNGCKRLLDKYQIKYDYFNISELEKYQYEYIVKSPGISLSDEIFKKLNGKIISDIELGYMITHPNIIGITGSNGKTTVSSMLDYILKNKYNVCLCGNIGYSFCDALVDKPGCDYYIVEMSSFQLEATYELDCVVSAILNVSMCHIDHHKSFEKYLEAKTKITSNQSFNNFVVYNLDDPYLKDIKRKTLANLVGFSYKSSIGKIYRLNEYIYYQNKIIFKIKKNELNYKHKIENYLAVLSILKCIDFNLNKACKDLKKFKDVKFRLNRIDKYIYNDAKSTNCASTMAAINSLDKIHLICGGYNRNISINLDLGALNKIKVVYAYGQTKELVFDYFNQYGIVCFKFENLNDAFRSAYIKRFNDENILYSPMFASYDQYNSYNERGEEFNSIYKKIKKP